MVNGDMKMKTASLTGRDLEILKIAQQEASVNHVGRFTAISRGPLFALLALAILGILCGIWLLAMLPARALRKSIPAVLSPPRA
jgi:hypothetical protein